MTLTVTFHNCSRPYLYRRKLEVEFRDKMLEFCPNPEQLRYYQERKHWRYNEAYWKAYNTVIPLLTDKEQKIVTPIVRFE